MAEFIRTSKTRVQGENNLSTKGSNNIRSTIENWLRHFANPELSLTEYRDETKYEEELLHPHRQGMGLFTFETSINCIQHLIMLNCSGKVIFICRMGAKRLNILDHALLFPYFKTTKKRCVQTRMSVTRSITTVTK